MQLPQIVEKNGVRVLTTRQLTEWYKTEEWQIKQNFRNNKERFVLGKHYITLQGEDLKGFKSKVENIYLVGKTAKILYLWTEKGALLHAKSLNTDKAWEVYDYLVDFYFRAKDNLPEQQETKPEPVKKQSGREVVDIPENTEMQAAIQEVHKQLVAIDTVLKAYNRYQCKENYLHLESTLELLWLETGRKITNLMDIEPNLVIKPGY